MKTLATDLDGTFYIDDKLIKGVKSSYYKLIENNFNVLFITNNSSILPITICKKLEKFCGNRRFNKYGNPNTDGTKNDNFYCVCIY